MTATWECARVIRDGAAPPRFFGYRQGEVEVPVRQLCEEFLAVRATPPCFDSPDQGQQEGVVRRRLEPPGNTIKTDAVLRRIIKRRVPSPAPVLCQRVESHGPRIGG